LVALCRLAGFEVISHSYYLSPLTLRVWDIGLRPLSAVLIGMIGRLSGADRAAVKSEWIDTVRPFLLELYDLDQESKEEGGYHCVLLEKI
jgi:hypothetical protein